MTKDLPNDPPRQSLRDQFSSEIFTVNARHDKKTGDCIVLWKDIQRGFPNVQYVLDGSNVVSFMTDDNFEEYDLKLFFFLL